MNLIREGGALLVRGYSDTAAISTEMAVFKKLGKI
jgi:hypothetical protein